MILRELFGPSMLLEYSRAAVLRQYGLKLAQKTNVFADSSQKYTPDVVAELAGSILSSLESADPTTDRQFSEWIVLTYLRSDNPFFPSQLERNLRQRLTRFIQLKQQYRTLLPDANINNYKSFDQFIQAIDAVVIPEKVVKNKGKAEEVYRDETVRIIIPRDEAAAVYYGQGTKWCTAYTDPGKNRFKDYETLFILLPLQPLYTGEKYQLHPSTLETKEEKNRNADSSVLITKRFPGLTSDQGQLTLAQQDPGWIRFFQKANVRLGHTTELELLSKDPETALYFNPKLIAWVKDPSEELQLMAIQLDPETISLIKTPEDIVMLRAINSYPSYSLYHLHRNKIQIPDYVLSMGCRHDPKILQHIFETLGTAPIEAQVAAVEVSGNAIFFITDNGIYPDEVVQLAAVKQDGLVIQFILNFDDEHERRRREIQREVSEDVQEAAVRQNGLAIQFILDAGIRPSEAVQQAAVEQTSDAYEFLIKARIQPSPAVEKLANRN